jgi:hypothetical protein
LVAGSAGRSAGTAITAAHQIFTPCTESVARHQKSANVAERACSRYDTGLAIGDEVAAGLAFVHPGELVVRLTEGAVGTTGAGHAVRYGVTAGNTSFS